MRRKRAKNKAGRGAILPAPRPAFLIPPASTVYASAPPAGGTLATPAEKVHPLRVCTFSAGLVTHSAACQRLTCRAGSLLLVRKEETHILKVGVRHGLQLPDRLPGQRLHIPVHIG